MLSKFRQHISKIINPLARTIAKTGISPNTLTLLGLFSSIVYLIFILHKIYIISLAMVILAGFFDVIDGAVAKLTGKVTKIGEFLDSTLDRLSDAILIIGLIFMRFNIFVIILLLIFSFLISYVRAKGELLGLKIEGRGLIERAERIIFIVVIIVAYMVNFEIANIIVLIFLVLTIVTFIDRTIFILRALT